MASNRLRVSLLGILLFALAWAGWYAAGARDRSLDTLLEAGVIRIGYAVEAPHAFLAPDGQVTGLCPELAKLVVGRLGVRRVEWRLAEFGALLAELEEGRVDVVAAGMFITPERARRAAFSEPVFHARQGLLVAQGNPLGLRSYEAAAAHPRARIATLSGSVEQRLLQGLGLPEARLVPVPSAQAGLAAVESGDADALALSSATLAWMALSSAGRVELAQPFAQPTAGVPERSGYGAFVFRRGEAGLLRAWNAAQAEIMAGPAYAALMERFGFSREEYPGAMSASEVLKP